MADVHPPPSRRTDQWLDGHFHIFLQSLQLAENPRHIPQYDATLQQYLELQRDHDLGGGLLVQPSFLGTDNSFLIETLREAARLAPEQNFKAVAGIDSSVSTHELKRLDAAGVVGARFNLLGRSTVDFDASEWPALLQHLGDLDWHIELQIEGERLPMVLPSLLRHSKRVVVDHFGRPDRRDPLGCDGFKLLVKEISGRLWVKTSAPYRVFPDASREDAAKRCAELGSKYEMALGAEALVWGSDWPWTQHETGVTFERVVAWRADWLKIFTPNGLSSLVPQFTAQKSDARPAR